MPRPRFLPWLALVAGLNAVSAADTPGPMLLRDVTPQTGITFRHTAGGGGKHYIVEYVASGAATFDYDGDGRIDIYFLNGRPLRGTPDNGPVKNRLYRNLGSGEFADVTDQAGVGAAGYGLGVAIGDYDNDGFPDIYVNNFGPNVLYRNRGDGTFVDVTAQAGVGRGDRVGAGVCFLDADADGRLDLFVANYVQFNYARFAAMPPGTYHGYHSPQEYPPETSQLFRNNGDGGFTDVSRESGVGDVAGPGMGMVCGDFNDDGATDVYVLNDVFRNFLFVNDGHGRFREVGLASGAAYDLYGQENGNMGVDCADYDHCGRLDLFVTTYQNQHVSLLKNLGRGAFDYATLRAGAGRGSFNQVKWGCGFADFDNDGYKDLFFLCGHLQDQGGDKDPNEAAPVLLRNMGKGKFLNVSDACGDALTVKSVGRAACLDDLDNDGRIDVAILNSCRPAAVLHNETVRPHHWLEVQLRGTKANRDGVGTRVRVVSGSLTQIDEVHSGRGYQSHFGSRLHFGLGAATQVERIEVRWLGGGVEVLEHVRADQILTLVEGAPTQ